MKRSMARALAATSSLAVEQIDEVDVAVAIPERLHTLYRAHAVGVVTRLRRLCGDDELARDLAHDAFVIAMRRIDSAPDDPPPAAWLHAIAYNLLRDDRRSRRRRGWLWSRHASGSATPAMQGEGPVAAPSLAARLDAALADLDHKQRDAFVLRNVEGLSLQEAADVLETTVQTVSYRAKQAEQRVRKHFEGESK